MGTFLGGAALFALASITSAGDAVADDCAKACARQQRACIKVAKNDYLVARDLCGEDSGCVRTASLTRRNEADACKAARFADCMPCCTEGGGVSGINFCATAQGQTLPTAPQEAGDPDVGRQNLLAGDIMTCGVPFKLWDIDLLQPFIAAGFAGDVNDPPVPGRTGNNEDLPYFLTAFTTPEGVEVVNANCLLCHGAEFDGELVIGLGNSTRDFTEGAGGGGGTSVPTDDATLDMFGLNEGEKEQVRRLFARGSIVGPQTIVRTVGMNPAEMLAVILMAHHDRDTLAWSETPLFDIVVRDHEGNPIADPKVTSDPPPWWRVHKKSALFYNGMARGDHRGTMSAATSVCVDTVPRALEVDQMFKDINAFIESIRAPAYPREIDGALADDGRLIFNRDCAGCHGTYDADEEEETYPNLLIPLDVVKTDPVVAEAGVVHTPELVDWYNASFYGQITPLEPNDPFPGYMPPPLDGIWATAPFLHNGSVPTIELVLNSGARPTFWKRTSYDSRDFDEDAIGVFWERVDVPQAALPENEAKFVYDTTYWSQSNKGHPFGDHLSAKERKAVLEYLKTL
ncbi:MAG TPA: hypothetical protein VEC57_10080 [Candidatus Limnocylindrales bacterium]|nr:hypothetical protein [Candidatus Limnocylindrales bacterium]